MCHISVMGLTVPSKIHILKPEHPVPQNAIIFGDRAFKKVIKLMMSLESTLIQYDWCPYKKTTINKPRRQASGETEPATCSPQDCETDMSAVRPPVRAWHLAWQPQQTKTIGKFPA